MGPGVWGTKILKWGQGEEGELNSLGYKKRPGGFRFKSLGENSQRVGEKEGKAWGAWKSQEKKKRGKLKSSTQALLGTERLA